MLEGGTVLVVAAHPDDELLGCGGTLALLARAGIRVVSVIVCEGESVRYSENPVGLRAASDRAAEILGIDRSVYLGFPDQGLDSISLIDLIRPVELILDE